MSRPVVNTFVWLFSSISIILLKAFNDSHSISIRLTWKWRKLLVHTFSILHMLRDCYFVFLHFPQFRFYFTLIFAVKTLFVDNSNHNWSKDVLRCMRYIQLNRVVKINFLFLYFVKHESDNWYETRMNGDMETESNEKITRLASIHVNSSSAPTLSFSFSYANGIWIGMQKSRYHLTKCEPNGTTYGNLI